MQCGKHKVSTTQSSRFTVPVSLTEGVAGRLGFLPGRINKVQEANVAILSPKNPHFVISCRCAPSAPCIPVYFAFGVQIGGRGLSGLHTCFLSHDEGSCLCVPGCVYSSVRVQSPAGMETWGQTTVLILLSVSFSFYSPVFQSLL